MTRNLLSTSVLLVALIAVCLGCNDKDGGSAGNSGESGGGNSLTIAVVPKSTGGEFWETVEAGAIQAGKDLGVKIIWDGTLTEIEIAEQNKTIENMINLEVDGMAIAPLNEKATARAVASAVDAKIPVVVFDSAIQGDKHSSFIATDNVAGGNLAGDHMVKLLGEGKKKLFVLRFVQGTASTENRVKGFIDKATEAGYEIAAAPYPEGGSVAGCKTTASNSLESYISDGKLELDGIFACNLPSALGMLEALSDLRKSGIEVNAKFVGFDTSPKLIKAIQEGQLDASVSQDPKKMGYLAVETIVKHLKGESVESIVDTGVELVTKERLENEDAIRELVGLEPKQ